MGSGFVDGLNQLFTNGFLQPVVFLGSDDKLRTEVHDMISAIKVMDSKFFHSHSKGVHVSSGVRGGGENVDSVVLLEDVRPSLQELLLKLFSI